MRQPKRDHELLLTCEAADYLRLSPRTLEKLRLTGEGPRYYKVGPGKGAKVVYKRTDLDAWLERFGRPGA